MASSVSELREKILDLTGQRVDVMIDEDTFKNTYQIMKELSSVWDSITDTSRANILEMVGGKRNANIVSALLENFTIAEEALTSSMNSAGSAVAENEKQLDSIRGKISLLQASFESLSATVINGEFIKLVVGGAAELVGWLEKAITLLGGLEVIIPSILGIFVSSRVSNIVGLFSGLKSGTGWLNTVVASVTKNISVFKAFYATITSGSHAASSALSMLGGTSAVVSASLSTLTAVIGIIAAVCINVKKKQEELRAELIAGSQAASSLSDEITDLYTQYSMLSNAIGEAGQNTQELASVQNSIIDKLGLHGQKVDELVARYGDYKKAITEATKEELYNQRLLMLGATSSYEQNVVDAYDPGKTINIGTGQDDGGLLSFLNDNYSSLIGGRTLSNTTSFHLRLNDLGYDLTTADGAIATQEALFEMLRNLEYHGFGNTKFFSDLAAYVGSLDSSISEYQNHLKDLDSNLLQYEYLNTLSIFGTPETQEDFSNLRSFMISSIETAKDFKVSYEDVASSVDDFLSKQTDFAKFFDGSANNAANAAVSTSINALDTFKGKIFLLKKALDEQNRAGSVTTDTYQSIIKLGEDCADMFDFSSGKITINTDNLNSYIDTLVKETGETLASNEATADQIGLMAALAESVKQTDDITADAAKDMESLVSVLDEMREGTSYGTIEIYNLIEQYPELRSAIVETADGYTIEESAILSLIRQKVKMAEVNNLLLSQQAKEARNALILASNNADTAENIDHIISKYNVDSFDSGKNSYVNAWKQHWGKNDAPDTWVSGVREYVEAVLAEKEYSKTVSDLLEKIMSGSYETGDDGGDGGDAKKNAESAFERAYKYHQHLLAMEKESDRDYLTWLTSAYQKAYKTGQIELDDYRKYQEEVHNRTKDLFEDLISDTDHAIENKINKGDYNSVVKLYQTQIKRIKKEIETYRAYGLDNHASYMQELEKQLWDYQDKLTSAIQEMVNEASEAIDGIQNAYSALHDAAKEYASTGALSTDTLQSILELAPKYLGYLTDENERLVINEEQIQKVIAARTDELSAETALAFAKNVLIAAENNDKKTLAELTQVVVEGSNATWDMVHATLELAKATGAANGMDSGYFEDAASYIDTIRKLGATASSSVSAYYSTLKDGYVSQADGLSRILEITQDLIKWENEQLLESLEAEKESYRDIIGQKKEMLSLSREQEEHDNSTADAIKEIADLQSRIDQLALDDSREAKAQRTQLESELAEKQKALAEEQADYAYDQQVEALDRQAEAFEKEKNDEIKQTTNMLTSTERLYRAAIDRITNQWGSLYDDLVEWNYDYGSALQSDLVSAWEAASNAVRRYGTFVSALDGVRGDTIVADTTPPGYASSIVDTMKKNSSMWNAASAPQRKALEEKNVELAAILARYLGKSITRGADGVWMIDGMKLYDIYHTGGVVGGAGTVAQNETMALLENGELVLDDKKQSFLLSAVGFFEELSTRIGSKIDLSKISAITGVSGQRSNLKTMLDELNGSYGGEFNFQPNVNVYITHSGEMTEADAKRYGAAAADSVLEKLNNAFSMRGILHTGHNLIKT